VLVIPAIDIRGGRAVRLTRGDFDQETVYGDDPVAIARSHRAAGAWRIHVVDLDAALGRSGDNREVVKRVVSETGFEVQVAGGIRDRATAEAWLEVGAAAVVMGTVAVRDPDLFAAVAEQHPDRVMGALDLRGATPQVSGWTEGEATAVEELLASWAELPLAAVILTSVDRDGSLAGPDLEALARILVLTRHRVIYGGGIGSLEDVRAVAAAGAGGVIIGKAIYEGRVDLVGALASVD